MIGQTEVKDSHFLSIHYWINPMRNFATSVFESINRANFDNFVKPASAIGAIFAM